jgi:hypothetical protein
MRSYSSGVTFVPMDFVRRDAMRGLLAAWHPTRAAYRETWLTAVPVWEPTRTMAANVEHFLRFLSGNPQFPCSTRDGVTCHRKLPLRSSASRQCGPSQLAVVSRQGVPDRLHIVRTALAILQAA